MVELAGKIRVPKGCASHREIVARRLKANSVWPCKKRLAELAVRKGQAPPDCSGFIATKLTLLSGD